MGAHEAQPGPGAAWWSTSAAPAGSAAENALERYADTIEEAGAQALAASLMTVLVEVGGTHATKN